jgi:hypothetical protein
VEVQAKMHIEADLTPKEYGDVIASIDAVFSTYVRHFPKHLEEISPLLAFKNALVLGAQEVKNV